MHNIYFVILNFAFRLHNTVKMVIVSDKVIHGSKFNDLAETQTKQGHFHVPLKCHGTCQNN